MWNVDSVAGDQNQLLGQNFLTSDHAVVQAMSYYCGDLGSRRCRRPRLGFSILHFGHLR